MQATEGEETSAFQEIVAAIEAIETEAERHLSIQIDGSLRDAIRAAQTSGQKASVTITVKVIPGPDRRVTFSANLASKLPKPPLATATLFADQSGKLHRSDPAQLRMFPLATIHTKKES